MQPLFSAVGERALIDVMQRSPLLAFDFDGTLAPIVARPEQARMPDAWSDLLAQIAKLRPVAIVTGREVGDVLARLSFTPHYVVGNHGAEDPAGILPTGSAARLDAVRRKLMRHAAQWVPLGIELEDKQFSLALHYRQAPDEAAARQCLDALLGRADSGLHVFHGKCVLNIAPADAPDKADAVASLVRRAGAGAALFAGDDVNDEPVFQRAPVDWLTLKVGRDGPPSSAQFFIDGEDEMERLLQRLLDIAQGQAG